MTELPIRRVLLVLVVYAGVAALILPGVDALQRILALPPVFGLLVRIGLVGGVPMAVVLAWRYPALGSGSSEQPEHPNPTDRG